MSRPVIQTPAEYALYALAIHYPILFREAEQFAGAMIAEDQAALARVKALLKSPGPAGDEWTGIRQDPAIRAWSSNPAADEAFARAHAARRRGEDSDGVDWGAVAEARDYDDQGDEVR